MHRAILAFVQHMVGPLASWVCGLLVSASLVAALLGGRAVSRWGVVAAAAWAAAPLYDRSPAVAATSLVLAASWIPAAALAMWSAAGGRHGRAVTVSLVVTIGAVWLLGLARPLVYEPFHDPLCRSRCVRWPSLVHPSLPVAEALVIAASVATLGIGAALLVIALSTFTRRQGWAWLVPGAIAAAAATMVAVAVAVLSAHPVPMPERPAQPVAGLTMASAFSVTVVLLAWCVDRVVIRFRLRRIGTLLVRGEASAQDLLATALRDRSAVVGYWVDGLGYVTAGGGLVPSTSPGRRQTELTSQGGPVAVVDHAEGLEQSLLERNLGPHIRLALQNENLALQLRRRVDELAASRQRVVSAADVARSRLERDLHDGAQQRVLALSLELRRGLLLAERLGEAAQARLFEGLTTATLTLLDRLRVVASGIFPAVLETAGLEAAVRALAATSSAPLELDVGPIGRLPGDVERAAYAVLASTRPAARAMSICVDNDTLRLRIDGVDTVPESVLDRIATCKGVQTRQDDSWEVRLPCVSSSPTTRS
jgi:signal transduction histidine kinase